MSLPDIHSLREQAAYETVEDAYTRAFVLGMGVRCPSKHKLIERFIDFCRESGNDRLLPREDEDIYNQIPNFIEHLAKL
mgnify:FL=1